MISVELIVVCEKNVFTNAVTTCVCFRAVTTFLHLKLIVLKNLQKARRGALIQFHKSGSWPFSVAAKRR